MAIGFHLMVTGYPLRAYRKSKWSNKEGVIESYHWFTDEDFHYAKKEFLEEIIQNTYLKSGNTYLEWPKIMRDIVSSLRHNQTIGSYEGWGVTLLIDRMPNMWSVHKKKSRLKAIKLFKDILEYHS